MNDALFVPLKTRHFKAFESGLKCVEYRIHGPRWNAGTCRLGRAVVLSHGYSGSRLRARVVSFEVSVEPTRTAEWIDCYGPNTTGQLAACITVALDPVA